MMQRSISMPVKPRYIDETPHLKRSEEKEELFIEEDKLAENSNPFLDKISYENSTVAGSDVGDKRLNKSCLSDKEEKYKWIWKDDLTELKSKQLDPEFNYYKQKQWTKKFRIIDKGGRQNITISRMPNRSLRYCKDFVTTLVEQDWKYTFTVFILSFVLSWVIFTALWYIIVTAHGDFLFDKVTGARLGEGKEPCVVGAKNLIGLFVYTVETQLTIGFGQKYPSEECPESVFLFVIQIIVSVAIEGAMIGIIYAKMAKPIKQVAKQKFSKNAVIYRRDGKLCFCFRVCDPNEQQSINTKININIVEEKKTSEGEVHEINKELKIDGINSPLLIWPETVCHVIDDSSPLYKHITDFDENDNFEIIVSLVGGSPSTGQKTESRTSYLPCEILWSRKFPNIIHYDSIRETHVIDFRHFNTTVSENEEEIVDISKSSDEYF